MNGLLSSSIRHAIVVALAFLTAGGTAHAVIDPLPPPVLVPGKVLSDYTVTGDQQSDGTQNPHMTREWDGLGNTDDSLDYSISLGAVLPPGVADDVDGLANIRDLFFKSVVNDFATLLVSPKVLQDAPGGGLNEIYFQLSTPFGGLAGPWAKNAPDIGGAPPMGDNIPPEGIDALEVWGDGRDHNIFSLYNDPTDVAGRKVSLFLYDALNDVSSAYVYNDEIRTALGLLPPDPDIDVDGLMVFDDQADGIFGAGDSIMFSVSETLSAGGSFHGGEIWVWNFGSPANFLFHGGVLWDSINQPASLFGWTFNDPGDAIRVNDINALEAILIVPEPSAIVLMLLSMLFAGRRSKR